MVGETTPPASPDITLSSLFSSDGQMMAGPRMKLSRKVRLRPLGEGAG